MFNLGIYLICCCLFIPFILGQASNDANNCECVLIYFCNNTDASGNIIDISARQTKCSYWETCCPKLQTMTRSPIIEPLQTPSSGCGYRNNEGVGYRIAGAGDNEAEFGEFPWMVAVMQKKGIDLKYKFKCGGTLIHPQVVLTAVHCINDGGTFLIRAGEWDTKTTQELIKHQEIKATAAVTHRDFKKDKLLNDIAMLFLEAPFNLTKHINVACLPPQNANIQSDECFVTGWGKDKFGKEGIYQNILKKIQLPIVNHEDCQKAFRGTVRLGKLFKLHRSVICAGGGLGQDSCAGDGGGPLVCPIEGQENRYQLTGIVSWGIGCGTEGLPGAYVDVAYFRDWIDERLRARKLSTSLYVI